MSSTQANREFLKPAKTFDEQLDILISRNLIVDNRTRAINILKQVNYYRFSAYSLTLWDKDLFLPNTSIDKTYSIYLFDAQLRHLLFGIIEPVEILLRTQFAYHLATKYGNTAHLDPSLFDDKSLFLKTVSELYGQISERASTLSIQHHLNNYGETPIWAAVECITFGALSKLYGNLNHLDQKSISQAFNTDINKLPGWFQALSYLRNICAHSSRIYGINLRYKIKHYSSSTIDPNNNVWNMLIALKNIYRKSNLWTSFCDSLNIEVEKHKDAIDLKEIGFPINWYRILLSENKMW